MKDHARLGLGGIVATHSGQAAGGRIVLGRTRRARAVWTSAATVALVLTGCTDGGTEAGSDPTASPGPTLTAASTTAPTSTSATTPAAVAWEPGPAEEYTSLSTQFVDDEPGDAERWADWLGCDDVDGLPVNAASHGCLLDTGHGPVIAIVLDWFVAGELSGAAESTTQAILAQQAGAAMVLDKYCEAGSESVASVALAAGYSLVVAADVDDDPEVRYDTATDVDDAVRRAAAIVGLDPDDVDAVAGVDVHRCGTGG